MKLKVKTNKNSYSVIVGKNLCSKIDKIILNERIRSQKFLLIYDSKVPTQMIKSILRRFYKKEIRQPFRKPTTNSLRNVRNALYGVNSLVASARTVIVIV